MPMRKTCVTIDDDLLHQVQAVLDTRTVRETIHEAFMEVLRERARREEVEALKKMEGMDLADAEVMVAVWRS